MCTVSHTIVADTLEGSRCSIFIFGLLARPERADASRRRQPHPDDSQNHNLTPDGRDQTEQPERGKLDGKRGGA